MFEMSTIFTYAGPGSSNAACCWSDIILTKSSSKPVYRHLLGFFTKGSECSSCLNTRTGKGLRITRPGKGGGGQILLLPAISASIIARTTKLGKRKDTPVNFMVCNFGDLESIF